MFAYQGSDRDSSEKIVTFISPVALCCKKIMSAHPVETAWPVHRNLGGRVSKKNSTITHLPFQLHNTDQTKVGATILTIKASICVCNKIIKYIVTLLLILNVIQVLFIILGCGPFNNYNKFS